MVSSKGDEWFTPLHVFKKYDDKYHFTTDPCTSPDNPLGCRLFFTKEHDGLKYQWKGNVWCNPPYGKEISKWVRACWQYPKATGNIAVMLIPARTDTSWFHDYIWQKRGVELEFIRGRLKFSNPNHITNTAPFPSMIVTFK